MASQAAQESPAVEIKLARIDITTFETADVYIFSRQSDTPSVSRLGRHTVTCVTCGRCRWRR
jgi:hypothetical protein